MVLSPCEVEDLGVVYSQYWSVAVIEYEAMAGFLGEKDLEEMMLRGTGEFIKFWDNAEGILDILLS